MADSEALKAKASDLPDKPGIYFFKNASGEVVYIGKARSLRDRVRSYFLPNPDFKVRNILRETADIGYILTGSEKEAAFLENNYVQQHQPKFNLRLKDDKSFPYLKVTAGDKYPGIYFSRKVEGGRFRFFGPFSPARRARTSIHLVNKHFRIRGCEDAVFRNRKRPCLEYDLGLCSAPCVGSIDEADYREDVENACLFLEGRTRELAKTLRARMEAAAAARNFEEAARWRDALRTIEDIRERPQAISVALEDLDVVGYARKGGRAAFYVFFMRRGKIRNSQASLAEVSPAADDAAALSDFLAGFYAGREKPRRLILPIEPAGRGGIERQFALPGGGSTRILTPRSGKGLKLLGLAGRNAETLLREREESDLAPLEDLRRVLGMKALPRRIEGFDISNTGGRESVGSMVVLGDGSPEQGQYRKFRIRTVEGSNDVASLAEVIRRRYARVLGESGPLPDLVMVDGGRGQLAAAEKALNGLGLDRIPVVSIAKREEILFTPGRKDGIRLGRTSPALKVIQRLRDEAHRFAIAYHRGRREKRSFESELDGIPGVGPKKKSALLARFGSLEAIRSTPRAELDALIGAAAAAKVLERLSTAPNSADT